MKWPFRHNGQPLNHEGKELAKRQLEIAKVIEFESHETALEHRWLMFNNHFGPNTAKALQEPRK